MGEIKGAIVSRAYSTRYNKQEDRTTVICHYFVRSEDGKKYHIQSYIDKPYIYAKIIDQIGRQPEDHPDVVEVSKEDYITQCGTKVKKIIVKEPHSVVGYKKYDKELGLKLDVPAVKKEPCFEITYEDNIEFPDRCAADHDIKYGMLATADTIVDASQINGYETTVMPHIVTIDSEIESGIYDPFKSIELNYVEFPSVVEATRMVLSIQCLDNQTNTIEFFRLNNDLNKLTRGDNFKNTVEKTSWEISLLLEEKYQKRLKFAGKFIVNEIIFTDEKTLIESFIDFIIKKDYDIICAFNGMEFDFPYLFSRMKNLSINYNRLSPLGYVTVRIKGTHTKEGYVDETDIRIPGRNLIDTKELFISKIYEKRARNGLDDFAMDYLGVGKVKHDPIQGRKGKVHSIDYEFFKQLDKFKQYACRDCILDFYLQKILQIWEHYIKLVQISGCQIFHVLKSRKRVRQRSLFYAKEMGYVLEPDAYLVDDPFVGALVEKPLSAGPITMAADLDLTSEYPSVILAWNISWDTLVLDHKIPPFNHSQYSHIIDIEEIKSKNIPYCRHPFKGVYFRLDRIGLFPKMVIDSKKMRKAVQVNLDILTKAEICLVKNQPLDDKMREVLTHIGYKFDEPYEINQSLIEFYNDIWDNDQKVLKIDVNSIYGNLPSMLAACVAGAARIITGFTRKFISALDYPPSYTDTDSVIFKTKTKIVEEADKIAKYLVDKLNSSYRLFEKKYGCFPNNIEIKSEEIYDPIIFIYKKTKKAKDEDDETAKKVYIKRLVADRGKILAKPRLTHKGLIKPKQSSKLAVDIGHLLIYYCGMNYSNDIIISRLNTLLKKVYSESEILEIPQNELDDMKDKRLEIIEGKYTADDVAFPVNIGKEWDEYKVLDYIKKAIIHTNKWLHTWSSVIRKFNKGDTAFMVFVKPESIPKDIAKNNLWALDGYGELHPDFKIDYKKLVERIISRYDPLLKAMKIDPNIFIGDKKQRSISDLLNKHSIRIE